MTTKHLLSILPSDLIDTLIQVGADLTRNSWRIGEIDSHLCALLDDYCYQDESGTPYTHDDMHKAVASLVGLHTRRVRGCAAVWRAYSDDQRAEYDVLPFSHFEFAMCHPDLTADILECSKRRMGETGRPPSVEWLEYNFHSAIHALAAQAETVIHDDALPDPVTYASEPMNYLETVAELTESQAEDRTYALHILEKAIDTIRALVERVGLPGVVKERVLGLLAEIWGEIVETAK